MMCEAYTFSGGMRGCRQLGVTRAPPSLIRPGIPAISHPIFRPEESSHCFLLCGPSVAFSSAWPNAAEIFKKKGESPLDDVMQLLLPFAIYLFIFKSGFLLRAGAPAPAPCVCVCVCQHQCFGVDTSEKRLSHN